MFHILTHIQIHAQSKTFASKHKQMRLIIPITALVTLLLNTSESFAKATDTAIANNFTCNEPFMIPAEYIDNEGNSFAMCFTDPRFHHKNVIWYIQAMSGPFKAIGVAKKQGAHEFTGTVIPIEQPGKRSGMHADPVEVNVRIDRSSGVITVNPSENNGKSVNWIIRPNGFPTGSLKVPQSCGPFLKPLRDTRILAPLTGADSNAKVCLVPGIEGDAFISWGDYKNTVNDLDPLALDGGITNKFFSVGFVGTDRGVSIDICDPGNDDANRCEMSRLVGHSRKTFVVGSSHDAEKRESGKKNKLVGDTSEYRESHDIPEEAQIKPHRQPRQQPNKHEHQIRSDTLIERIEMIESDILSILKDVKPEKRHKKKKHREDLDNDRQQEKDKVRESDSDSDNDLKEYKEKSHHRKKINNSHCDLQDNTEKPHQKHHRKNTNNSHCDLQEYKEKPHHKAHTHHKKHCKHHKRPAKPETDSDIEEPCPCHLKDIEPVPVKECPVHALLHPSRDDEPISHAPQEPVAKSHLISPPVHPEIQRGQIDTLNRLNRLHLRLNRLDAKLNFVESIIATRLDAFNRWLIEQKRAMQSRAANFTNFLAQLKRDTVKTPKSAKNKFLSSLSRTIRKAKRSTEGLFEGSDSELAAIKRSVVSFEGQVGAKIKDTLGTATSSLGNTVNSAGSFVGGTVRSAEGLAGNAVNSVEGLAGKAVNSSGNLVGGAVNSAGNLVNSTEGLVGGAFDSAGNFVGNAINSSGKFVGGALDSAGNIVGSPLKSTENFLGNTVNTAEETVKSGLNSAENLAGNAMNSAGNLAGNSFSSAGSFVGNTVNAAGAFIGNPVNSAENVLGTTANTAGTFFSNTVNSAENIAGTTANTAGTALSNAANNADSLLDSTINSAKSAAGDTADAISRTVAPITKRFDLNDDLIPPISVPKILKHKHGSKHIHDAVDYLK